MCVNSASTNSAACAAPGAALPVPGARPRAEAPGLPARLALVASGNLSGGRALQETLPQTHRPRLVHPAAGLSPAPQTLLAEKGLEEGASPDPGLCGSSSPGACAEVDFAWSLAVQFHGFVALGRLEHLCQPVSSLSPLATLLGSQAGPIRLLQVCVVF